MSYRKSDVDTHGIGYFGSQLPAVNVKVYRGVDVGEVMSRFDCSEKNAITSLEYVFEAAQREFWEDAPSLAREILRDNSIRVYSEGRSGGWLVVAGLPEVEKWDALMLSRWRKFERAMRDQVRWLSSGDFVFDVIGVNRWVEEGAERYNFLDKNGNTVCMVDVHEAEREAAKQYIEGVVGA